MLNHEARFSLAARDTETDKGKLPGLMELTAWLGKAGKVSILTVVSGVEKAQALKGIHSMCLAICNFLKSLLDAS